MGVCFLQLFDLSTPKASNCNLTERDFSHAYYFPDFGPLKSKYLEKNYMVIPLSGCLIILAFKISKKLNIGLKIGILKMLSKNSVSFTHTGTHTHTQTHTN